MQVFHNTRAISTAPKGAHFTFNYRYPGVHIGLCPHSTLGFEEVSCLKALTVAELICPQKCFLSNFFFGGGHIIYITVKQLIMNLLSTFDFSIKTSELSQQKRLCYFQKSFS